MSEGECELWLHRSNGLGGGGGGGGGSMCRRLTDEFTPEQLQIMVEHSVSAAPYAPHEGLLLLARGGARGEG